MSYVNGLFIRKKVSDIKEGSKRRSILISVESAKIKEIQDLLTLERQKSLKLEDSICKAEESMRKKNEDYEKQIKELREQIVYYRLHPTPTTESLNKHLDEIDNLHQKVLLTINDFKLQIEQQIKDQEKDTIKRFDMKLAKICSEIEERKKKRIMELSSMANTEKKVSKDLENLRESAILVEKKNSILEEENKKIEQKIMEKDKEFQYLMQEFYVNRKKMQAVNAEIKKEPPIPQTPGYMNESEYFEDKTDRYENVIGRLRKQLEIERKNLKAVRNAYAEQIESRTEMENVVRRYVEEIRENMAMKNRIPTSNEEKTILIDKLLNSTEVFNLLNKNIYQSISSENLV